MSTRVFVYGSLMRGFHNHRLLEGAAFEGRTTTLEASYIMLDMGAYPGVRDGGRDAIVGEIYRIDAPTLAALDRLEEHPRLYRRRPVPLADHGEAWLYVLQVCAARMPVVPAGDWRAYRTGNSGDCLLRHYESA